MQLGRRATAAAVAAAALCCLALGAWFRQKPSWLIEGGRVGVRLVRGGQELRLRRPLAGRDEQEPVWEPISDFDGRYYADLIANPGETPEEFLAKEGHGELPPGLLPAGENGGVENLGLAGARHGTWARRYGRRAPGVHRSRRTTGTGQMLEENDWNGPKQTFRVPDLEQETDGLDMMQDFAPQALQAQPAPPQPANGLAGKLRVAPRDENEDFTMHSLRNAFEAKALPSPQSLYQQPPRHQPLAHARRLPALAAWPSLSTHELVGPVHPTARSIDKALQTLLLRARKRAPRVYAPDGQGAVRHPRALEQLRSTVERLQQVCQRDLHARDLVARRLSFLGGGGGELHPHSQRSQKLLDYDSVYLAPYVDDLDDYLQGILDEVNRTEIPTLEDEDKAVGVFSQKLSSCTGAQEDCAEVQHDPEAVALDVGESAFWGDRGGKNVVNPSAWHHHTPLSIEEMADGDYLPDAYASGGHSHSSVGADSYNQYKAKDAARTMLRALPWASPTAAAPGVVTYTAETSGNLN